MLIWDTGVYSILPYRESPPYSDDEPDISAYHGEKQLTEGPSHSEKLHAAFAQRKIRLRLHGTRLPKDYTLGIWMARHNFRSTQPAQPRRRRRRRTPALQTSDSESPGPPSPRMLKKDVRSLHRLATPPPKTECKDTLLTALASEEESETIRRTNAYPGATNDIGSIHQRTWYLSLHRRSSGFSPIRDQATPSTRWVQRRDTHGNFRCFDKFWALGRARC